MWLFSSKATPLYPKIRGPNLITTVQSHKCNDGVVPVLCPFDLSYSVVTISQIYLMAVNGGNKSCQLVNKTPSLQI